jgi:hypothetical protein
MDDPTFAFVTADWPDVVARNLERADSIGSQRIDGKILHGFRLKLRLFEEPQSGGADPQLECWLTDDEQLRLLTLRWPVMASVLSEGGSTSNPEANTSWINVTVQLATDHP